MIPLLSKTTNSHTNTIASRSTTLAPPNPFRNKSTFLHSTRTHESNEELHPEDPASTTPQLLAALWHLVAAGCKDLKKGQSFSVLYPNMEQQFASDLTYLERLMGHLDACKDVCDDFGINTILSPIQETKKGRKVVTGFTVKSYKDPNKIGTFSSDGDFKFAPDPFFDDADWDALEDKIRAAAEEDAENNDNEEEELDEEEPLLEIVDKIPDSDDKIIDLSKKWVNKIMSDMGICPFTKGADMAGLPMGQVFYTVDRSTNIEEMYAAYWEEVVRVEQSNETELSTTLLIAPEFLIDNVEMFENFSGTLTQPLEALGVEDLLQLVFFHPDWTFRDGGERSGMGSAANYARRSPWPMINILRTSQVRAAQKGIPTGLVYQQNEKTLSRVGAKSLEKMLRLRDWSDIADLTVDRKDMEALRVAQDLQDTGIVADVDTSVMYDSTPAANRVDRAQIEGGDILNVILQALEKRLKGGEGGGVLQLSGAETSAAMMASDFLLEHLEVVANSPPKKKIPVNAMAERYFDTDEDEFSQGKVTEEDEMNVLFGGGGIMKGSNSDGDIFGSSSSPFRPK